ncbi:hypothetical protein IWX49DRAFT_32874 [Phyllosticta citricarpa]
MHGVLPRGLQSFISLFPSASLLPNTLPTFQVQRLMETGRLAFLDYDQGLAFQLTREFVLLSHGGTSWMKLFGFAPPRPSTMTSLASPPPPCVHSSLFIRRTKRKPNHNKLCKRTEGGASSVGNLPNPGPALLF